MHFHKTISFINEPTEFKKSIHRTAARAIMIEGEKILMVRSELGYFKLPGGGVEEGENLTDALIREVAEETGYISCKIMEPFGTVFEQRSDHAAADSYFQMESHYFLCKLSNNETAAQKLIGYEMEEGYTPVWVSIQEAIASNESVFEKDESHIFIVRENFVMDWLKRNFEILYSPK